jgi:uncharacterized protein YkwD
MKSRVWGLVFLLALKGAPLSAGAAAASPLARAFATGHAVAAQSYERWVRAPAPWPLERQLLRAVKLWAKGRGLELRNDARLTLVARAALGEIPRTCGARLDADVLRARAHRWGWTDGELAAVALRVPEAADVDTTLKAELEARLGTLSPNRVGLAARLDAGSRALLVLFSRRLISLWPVPAQINRGARFALAGSVSRELGEQARALTLVLGRPSGAVERRPLALSGTSFETAIDSGQVAGTLDVQLLVDRGRGPEIAAQFPVGIDRAAPKVALEATAPGNESGDAGDSAEDLSHRLAALVLGAREAAQLTLPAASAALAEVAAAHADEMRQEGYFAHVSPRHGDLRARLRARGVAVSRALENLARAPDVESVLRQWLASPAHRANLLDGDIDAFGVGVAPMPSGEVLAVLVLARRADEGDTQELAARALVRLNALRLRQGLVPLAWDEDLAKLAAARSRQAAQRQGSSEGDLVASILRELQAGSAAADVFASPGIDVVLRSRNALSRFERAGIGIDREPGEGRLWITVLYAAD